MPPPPKHRQAIVDAAVTLFRRQGYAATGLAEIVAVSGAPKGSLYHYFPAGKAAIGAAAVEEAGRRVVGTVAELADQAASAGELVRAHAALLAGWMAKSGYRDGSPMTTVLLENAPDDDAITAAGQAAHTAWRRLIADRLVADGFPPARAERLAVLALAVLEGALLQARVEKTGTPLKAAADEFDLLLQAATGGRAGRRAPAVPHRVSR